MIESFWTNGKVYPVDKNGNIDSKRDPPRAFRNGGEASNENDHLHNISDYNYKNSKAAKWIKDTFYPLKVNRVDLKAITKIFAKLIGTFSYRENYRRVKSCYKWLDEHLIEIYQFLSQNKLFVTIKGRTPLVFRLPDLSVPQNTLPPSDPLPDQQIKNDQNGQKEFEIFIDPQIEDTKDFQSNAEPTPRLNTETPYILPDQEMMGEFFEESEFFYF